MNTRRKRRSYISINRKDRSMEMELSYRVFEEDGEHYAECPELKLIDQGKTKLEAYENLWNMILTTLIVAVETDTVYDHLNALGFKKVKIPVPMLEIYDSKKSIDSDCLPLIISEHLPGTTGRPSVKVQIA